MNNSKPVALVTGSSRGIGKAIALKLSQSGYDVAVNYVRQADAAEQLAAEISAGGGSAIAVQGNVGDAADRQKMVDAVNRQWNRIDLLVNNAGITSPGRKDILEATEESWDTVMSINLKGAFFLSQLVARRMIEQTNDESWNGKIVNISSISAYATSANRADYCIAKAGMQMMTWLFAERLAEHGINVFEICPGVIRSDMTAPVQEKYDRLIADGLTPIRRWGTPEDVAKAVAAIALDAFPFSTGERINVDGGFHFRRL